MGGKYLSISGQQLSLPSNLPIRTPHPLHHIRLFEEASWSWLSLSLSLLGSLFPLWIPTSGSKIKVRMWYSRDHQLKDYSSIQFIFSFPEGIRAGSELVWCSLGEARKQQFFLSSPSHFPSFPPSTGGHQPQQRTLGESARLPWQVCSFLVG